ncbi:GtrA family protein [Streptomyces capparidis]
MSRGQASGLVAFALVGVVNTGTYYAVYLALTAVLPYLAAHAGAYAVSLTGSFLLNCRITCRTRPTWRKFALYPLSGAVNLAAGAAALYVCVAWCGLSERVAPLVGGVAVVPLSYAVTRRVLAPRPPRPAPVRTS